MNVLPRVCATALHELIEIAHSLHDAYVARNIPHACSASDQYGNLVVVANRGDG